MAKKPRVLATLEREEGYVWKKATKTLQPSHKERVH